jgi:hypothetical protein
MFMHVEFSYIFQSNEGCGKVWVCQYKMVNVRLFTGPAVGQWCWHGATNRKVAGSIPDGVLEFFIDIILPAALRPWD